MFSMIWQKMKAKPMCIWCKQTKKFYATTTIDDTRSVSICFDCIDFLADYITKIKASNEVFRYAKEDKNQNSGYHFRPLDSHGYYNIL